MTSALSPTLVDVGVFVIIAVFLLGGIRQILAIIEYFKAKPPVHEQFVKISQCKLDRSAAKEGLDKRLDAIDDGLDTLEGEDRKGRSGIHHDVRDVEKRVAALEAQSEGMNQQLTQNGVQLGVILSKLGSVEGQLKRIRTT